MIDISKLLEKNFPNGLALLKAKIYRAQLSHASEEVHEAKGALAGLPLPADVSARAVSLPASEKSAAFKQAKSSAMKKPASPDTDELPSAAEELTGDAVHVDVALPWITTADTEQPASVLYAQAQIGVVSDSPAGLTLPNKQAAVAATPPTASVSDWVDAVKAVDQIPFSALLGGMAVVAAAGGGKGASSDTAAPAFQSAATSVDGAKVVLTFSEALSDTTAASSAFVVTVAGVVQQIGSVLVNGKTVELTLGSAVANGQTVTVAYTDPTADNDAHALQDLVGNDVVTLAATNVANKVPDTTPPTMAVSSDKTFISKGQTALLTFTVSEAVTDFTQADVTVSGGTLSNFTGSGKIYSATFTPTANSTSAGSVSVASSTFSDASGNQNADGADANNSLSLTIDTLSPSIAISADKTSLNAAQTATLTFTLSDTSTDFNLSDVTVGGGTLSNFSGSGTTYTATFTPVANSTTVGSVNVGSGKFSDAAGNLNADGADANNSVSLTVDTVPPTIAVSTDKSTITKGQTAQITFTLSEAASDFTLADVMVSGGTLSNFAGSGTTYTAMFTPTINSTASGSVSVASGKFSDASGNQNADGADANNSLSLTIDTLSPSIAISADKTSLNAAQTATLTFTLSDTSTDFNLSDVTVGGGTLSNFSGSGTTYTATFTPVANSTTVGSVNVGSGKFSDAAGNLNADGADANNSVSLTVDTVPPTIAVSTDKSTITKGQTAQITFTLSEAASDFTLADVMVSEGALSNFAGSGTTYTAMFTPTINSTASGSVSVASDKFSDAAGNLNADGADANNQVAITVSPVAPVAQLNGSWTDNPQVTMAINLGNGNTQNVVVEVYPDVAPGTVANWLAYVNSSYYSNLIFHRVIAGFMVQAGAFTSDLVQHAATYSAIPLETTQTTGLSNLTGTIAMARTSVADSATSQFFINVADNTFLDYSSSALPGYAVFGKVLSGMSTVNSIATVSTGTVSGMADVPNNPITLNSVSQTAAGTAYSSTGKIDLSGLEQGATYSYSLDGSSVWTSLPASQSQIDLGSTLTAGLHTVAVIQTDSAGNASAAAMLQFTKYVRDDAHSVLDLLTDTSGGANDGTATDNITQSTSLSLTAALSNAFAGKTVWLMDQGVKVGSALADTSGHLSWQGIGAALGDHAYTLYDPANHVRIADTNIATSELLVRVV
jgi:uncharacterized repeat protein (TIGR02059 family)